MDPTGDVASVLVADDPRGQAAKLLKELVRFTRAQGAVALRPDGEDLRLIAGADVGLERLAEVADVWKKHRREISAGHHLLCTGAVLAALKDGRSLAGVMVLEGGEFDPDELGPYMTVLAKALAADASRRNVGDPEAEHFLAARQVEDVERRELLRTLKESEWNVSLAARKLHVTRRTVYQRMVRLRIRRVRIRKGRARVAESA